MRITMEMGDMKLCPRCIRELWEATGGMVYEDSAEARSAYHNDPTKMYVHGIADEALCEFWAHRILISLIRGNKAVLHDADGAAETYVLRQTSRKKKTRQP